MGRKRVARLMRELGIPGVTRRRFRIATMTTIGHQVEQVAGGEEVVGRIAVGPRLGGPRSAGARDLLAARQIGAELESPPVPSPKGRSAN